ncbi:MAG: hypothetical protein NVSMB27_08900 [Ktedonobacteraceae bacterium]
MNMKESTYQKFAGAAAFIVALSSLAYGLIYLLLVPAAQKQLAKTAGSLTSFAAHPAGRQIASLLLALGGLAATAAIVGIYRRVREVNEDWARWSLLLGFAYGLLTTIYGISLLLLFPVLSGLYSQGNAATQAGVLVVGSLPSPLDPYGFTKFVLSGFWLLITGGLMLRSRYFARPLAYLTLVAGIGVLLLFIGNATNTTFLILATGLPGSAIIGPLFWLWVGYTLWSKQ